MSPSTTRPRASAAVGRTRLGRILGVALALVLTLSMLPSTLARAEQAATNQESAQKAADWLRSQWESSPATGAGTISDYVIALSSADAHHDTIDDMLEALATSGPAYATTPATLGKVLLAAAAGGHEDPAHLFGPERDLVAELLGQVAEEKSVASFGSYLALLALLRLDADIPAESLTYLTDRMFQTASGGFSWSASATAGDPDFTGLGISALNLLAETTDDAGIKAEAERRRDLAIAWSQDPANQRTSGEFHFWGSSSTANSTGFLAGALAESGEDVTVPQSYLRALQAQTTSGAAWPSTHTGTADNLPATLQAILGVTGKMYGLAQRSATAAPEPAPTVTVTVTVEPTSTPTVTETVTAQPASTPTVTETVTAPPVTTLEGVCEAPADGVTVVIDFGDKTPEGSEQVVAGCAEGEQADGFDALASAGFAVNDGVEGAYPGTVCTIESVPVEGYPECWFVGYWSYWHAEPGELWEYSQLGAGNRTPSIGSVEGWRWLDLSDLMTPPAIGPTFHAGVDTTAPVISVTSRPAALVTGTTAEVKFGVDDLGAKLECRLDSQAWAQCPPPSGWDASTFTYKVTDLTPGAHVIAIRATDIWGNVAVTELSFTQGEPAPTPTITQTVTAEPTSTPTITQTVTPEPTSTPTITQTVTAEPTSTPTPPAGPTDIYTTVGTHHVNGRFWHTTCEPYSQVQRCRTEIWGTRIELVDGAFVQSTGWVFNNLTYTAGPRALWAGNPLGNHNAPQGWVAADGRRWYTECDTATTGGNGCRSYVWATYLGNTANRDEPVRLGQITGWVFNNMVRFE